MSIVNADCDQHYSAVVWVDSFGIDGCSFPLVFSALLILKPYEVINKIRTIKSVREEIAEHADLAVIGITGSFGKTSTKDFLFEILNSYQSTLKTPASYNTVFGIAKVVNLELVDSLKYFICEMGAYVRGEIKELTKMVPPDYAILTAVGTQHLERFRSLGNTTLAKFELIDVVKPSQALVNLDNELIRKQIEQKKYQGIKTYSFFDKRADFWIKGHEINAKGVEFELVWQKEKYKFVSPLFGTSNLQNLTAAISMALMLGVPPEKIKAVVAKIRPSAHRLELKLIKKSILIDDAYSSNEQGFKQVLADLKKLPGK